MAKAKRSSKSSDGGTVKIDFREATKGGGQRVRLPEGDYKVQIAKAERSKSQSGNTQIKVTYKILAPEKAEGKTLVDYMTLSAKAAYRVGNLLDAIGVKWSAKVMELPLGKLKGKTLGVTVHDGDPYKGRVKSEIGDWLDEETIDGILEGTDEEELDEDEDEDDVDEDEDEDEDDDDEDLDELDDDDL
jgi:hypothetical protein